jgi:hypothetical protein
MVAIPSGSVTSVSAARRSVLLQRHGHWWLGDFVNGQIRWSLVSRARARQLLDGRHPVWLGDFTGVGRTQVLFYYNGDGHCGSATS